MNIYYSTMHTHLAVFSHSCFKMPDKSNLRKEVFLQDGGGLEREG